MNRCVKCLGKPFRNPVRKMEMTQISQKDIDKYDVVAMGTDGSLYTPKKKISVFIIQCEECGYNVTSHRAWEDAEYIWNNFRVWELVERLEKELKIEQKKNRTKKTLSDTGRRKPGRGRIYI